MTTYIENDSKIISVLVVSPKVYICVYVTPEGDTKCITFRKGYYPTSTTN